MNIDIYVVTYSRDIFELKYVLGPATTFLFSDRLHHRWLYGLDILYGLYVGILFFLTVTVATDADE